MKACYMPPSAPTLMWSIRAIGYTTPAAVADLIDNSIYAKASQIFIYFITGENSYVSILDNGEGMEKEDLKEAMKYGSGNPWQDRYSEDLGRFGLGLKTASLSQCRKLTVISKCKNGINGFCWDLDYVIEEAKDWELLELDQDDIISMPQYEKLETLEQGTLVVWQNLDKLCAGDEDKERGMILKIRDVEEHLAVTFHRFLQGEPGISRIQIFSNEVPIQAKDPFYTAKSDEMPSEKIPVTVEENGEGKIDYVIVTPYILPFSDSLTQNELNELGGKEGLIKNQGFYIYRNKRLIVAADWFRLARKTDLTKLCRVKVDLPNSMDEAWTLDVKKSMAIPPEIVLRNLKRIITPILNTGKRKYRFRAKKEASGANMRVWMPAETRNGVVYSINREYPIVKDLIKELGNSRKLDVLFRLIEQNIPLNTIHSDFYDDKKFACEDMRNAYMNVVDNLKMLLRDIKQEERIDAFKELMQIAPFSEFEITYDNLGDIDNG